MKDRLQKESSKLHAGRAGGIMRATLDSSGKMSIEPVASDEGAAVQAFVGRAIESSRAPVTEPAEALVEDEQPDVEERTMKLKDVLREHREEARALERAQIVEVLVRYANDCGKRAEELVTNAKAAVRDSVRKQRVVDADLERALLEQAENRGAAFRVRQAVTADLANKVAHGWGRNEDGTAQ